MCQQHAGRTNPALAIAEAKQLADAWTDQSVSDAVKLYLKVADLLESVNDLSGAAESLRSAGELMLWQNRVPDSQATLDRALSLEPGHKNLEGKSRTIYLLALASLKENRLKKADGYAKRLVEIGDKTQSAAALGRGYFVTGEVAYRNRRISSMIDAQERALTYFQDAEDHNKQAEVMTYLSQSYVMKNERLRGLEIAEAAVNLQRHAGNKRGLTFALIAYGDANQRIGELKKAKDAFDEAEKLFPEGLDRNERASLFTKIGIYYEVLGELKTARKYFQNAQTHYRLARNLFGNSELLTVIGQISLRLGETDDAISHFSKGLRESEKIVDPWSLGMVHERIGDAYFRKGSLDLAERHYRKALSLSSRSNDVAFRRASVLHRLGVLYESKHDRMKALRMYSSSLNLSQQIRDTFATAETLHSIARTHSLNGQTALAIEILSQSIDITETLNSETDNQKLKTTFFSDIYERYELYVNLLMRMEKETGSPNFAAEALVASEQARARSLRENVEHYRSKAFGGFQLDKIEREKYLRDQLNKQRNKLTDLLSANADAYEIRKADEEAIDVERQLEELRAELRQPRPMQSATGNLEPFSITKFQEEVLDDDSLFLEFSLGNEESYLWLVGKTTVEYHVLPPREQLETRITGLLELLKARERRKGESIDTYNSRIGEADLRYAELASQLSTQLLGRAADRLTGKRLIISPDGNMGYLPFGALPFPNSEKNPPILVTNEIVYAPSASIYGLLKTAKREARPMPEKDVLIFADAVFDASDERLREDERDNYAFQGNLAMMRSADSIKDLRRLPASGMEAEAVSNVAGRSTIISGFAANRERVFDPDLVDYRVIHFATHGVYNEEYPELSGLLLSLYDERGLPNDGFIRTQDIHALNLNSDLVVLSACDSGIGRKVRGEGIVNLNAAFFQAGARSVVSSLWKVDDEATRKLMSNFYRMMTEDELTPAEALRAAQLTMMRDPRYRSPFYWAAFTVHGDAGVRMQLSSTSRFYVCVKVIVGLVIFLSLLVPIKRYFLDRFITRQRDSN